MNGIYYELCKKDIFHELCKQAFKGAKYAKYFARLAQRLQKYAQDDQLYARRVQDLQKAEEIARDAEVYAQYAKEMLEKSQRFLEVLKTANFKEYQDLVNCIEISVKEAKKHMK